MNRIQQEYSASKWGPPTKGRGPAHFGLSSWRVITNLIGLEQKHVVTNDLQYYEGCLPHKPL